jgi:hypothetical protein
MPDVPIDPQQIARTTIVIGASLLVVGPNCTTVEINYITFLWHIRK